MVSISCCSKSKRFARVSALAVPPSILKHALLLRKKKKGGRAEPGRVVEKVLRKKVRAAVATTMTTTTTTTTITTTTTTTAAAAKATEKRLEATKKKGLEGAELPHQQVYVLELEGGYVYVGKAGDVGKRVQEHLQGRGAYFTSVHRPTGRVLPRLGTLTGPGDGPERDETLRQMLRVGVDMVRGWKYVSLKLSSKDRADIEGNIRELLDLCRRCGRAGHFVTACKCKTDRNGRALRPCSKSSKWSKPRSSSSSS